MKRPLIIAFIVAYLSALSWGVISHTLALGNTSHPLMYYVIWDMFCGWSGYETRHHIVAQGVSGNYYALNPAPWGEFKPYGPATRPDYDSFAIHWTAIAHNVLSHTDHEPMQRIFLIEENWSKRYNRPDFLWRMEFEEEKVPRSYFHTRLVCDVDGQVIKKNNPWTTAVFEHSVASDTRMASMLKQARPFMTASQPAWKPSPETGQIQQTSFEQPAGE